MSGQDDLRRRFLGVRANEAGPDWADVERRAGERRHRRPFYLRVGVALATALLVGSGFGFALGTSSSNGNAASGPVGLGFLPATGWDVRQSGVAATPERPAVAIASNVPLSRRDDADGLPLSTLRSLSPSGVVIVVGFTGRSEHPGGALSEFPVRTLPLRVRDAEPIEFGTQVRPKRPLGQYRLTATVNRYAVEVSLYFGTPKPRRTQLVAAQRQLDRLVVRLSPPEDRVEERALPFLSSASTPRVLDRTLVCSTVPVGGARKIKIRAHAGVRENASEWKQLAFAVAASGTVASSVDSLDNSLAWITAGSPGGHTSVDSPTSWPHYPHNEGTIAFNRRQCTPSAARVPLVPARLEGGAASPLGEEIDCLTPRRVLVRVRAVMQSPVRLFGSEMFLKTTMPAREGYLAVRTLSGKPLVFASVLASGKARLFTASSCLSS